MTYHSAFDAARGNDLTWWRRPGLWAVTSAALVLLANSSGIAVGDDGIGYRAIADRMTTGRGLGYFLEPHLTIWPPGWPALMALVSKLTGLDAEHAAVLLNALTAAATVLLVDRLVRRVTRREGFQFAMVLVAAVGTSTMLFGHLLMTDFSFAAITLAGLLALLNYRDQRDLVWLGLAIVLVWAGFMVRYAGVVNIAIGALWLLNDRSADLRGRVLQAAGFAGGSALVPAAWVLRNIETDGTLMGLRYSSNRGLLANAGDMVATVGNFVLPGVASERRGLWLVVAAVGIATMSVAMWRAVLRWPGAHSLKGLANRLDSASGLLTLHVAVFAAYMLYARTTTGLNRLDFRLLHPMYLPLCLIAIALLSRMSYRPNGLDGRRWGLLSFLLTYGWAALNIVVGLVMVGYFATAPDLFVGNYERPAFHAVRASPALQSIPRDCPTGSNLPNALYGSGVEAQWSPRRTGLESDDKVDDLARLDRHLANGPYCLVWIDLPPRYGHLVSLSALRHRYRLDEVSHDRALTVYRVFPRVRG
ncbi:MAG: glycosyltransferase family 39 protein [Microthrixaceae bacterium]